MMPRISLKYLHPVADRFKDICNSITKAIPEERMTKTLRNWLPMILRKFFMYTWEDVTNGHNVVFHEDRLFTVALRVEKIGLIPKNDKRKRIFCSKVMSHSFEIDVIGRFKEIFGFVFIPDKKMLEMLWNKLDNTDIAYDLIGKERERRSTGIRMSRYRKKKRYPGKKRRKTKKQYEKS